MKTGLCAMACAALAMMSGPLASQAADKDTDIIAECAIPVGLEHRLIGFVPASFGDELAVAREAGPRLLLTHDEAGYDIVFDNRNLGQMSLRQTGAEISAPKPSEHFVQVRVAQQKLQEQYLFHFNADGAGMLMWVGEYRGDKKSAPSKPARAMCRQLSGVS